VRPRHPFLVSFVSAMSKRNASAASAAAFDAADDDYDDDADDGRIVSILPSRGMMAEGDDDNIVPARHATTASASSPSVADDEDTPPAVAASSSSTGRASSFRLSTATAAPVEEEGGMRVSTISTLASATTTIGGSGGGAGGGNATELNQRRDTMMDRVAKRLREAAYTTPATPTGENKRLACMAFSRLIKKDEVYSAIVDYADDEEQSQEISDKCISHAGMEGNVSVDLTASAALTA